MFAFVIVLLSIGVLSANAGDLAVTLDDKETADKCFKEIGITLEIAEASMKNGMKDADEKFKCFTACVFKEKHWLKNDGSIDIEKAIKDLPDEIIGNERDVLAKTIEKCSQKKESNECETVFNAIQCTMQELSKFKI